MKSILDPTFKYVSANNTDIAKTFARVRREQAAARAGHTEQCKEHMTPRPGQGWRTCICTPEGKA